MRHDVISATLPVDQLAIAMNSMAAKWGPRQVADAANMIDNEASRVWTLELLSQVDEQLTQEVAQAANMRMLDRDEAGFKRWSNAELVAYLNYAHPLMFPRWIGVDMARPELPNAGLLVEHKPGARVKGGAL